MTGVLRFKDKVVIVTGGCNGIGRGCVEVFVENGGTVAVLDIIDEVGDTLSIPGPRKAYYIHCDVCNEKEIQEAIEKVVSEFGRIDCLVNNVGRNAGIFPIDDISVEDFRQLLDVNLVSVFAMSKYALPHLRKTKGSIVNISSFSGTNAQALMSTYCSSKGAVRSLSKALAIDESKYGVRVNTICPGPVDTPALQAWLQSDEGKRKMLESLAQLGRVGEPREIGLACIFLATDATFTTGADFRCTGGSEIGYGVKSNSYE